MGILRSVPRVCALVGVWCWGGAWAETASPTGNTLHKLVAGRTIVLETGMGGIPIVYQADGGMKGSASGLPASMLEGPREDRGRWWIARGEVCQRWKVWLAGRTYCYRMRVTGKTVQWWRDDGRSGTARLVSN